MTAPGAAAPALTEPVRRVGRPFVAAIALANLGIWMAFFTPIQLLLPEQLEDIDAAGKVGALGWVTGAGAAVAIVVTPLAGALSDRTRGRFGRRVPWIAGGTALAVLALIVLSRQSTVLGVLLGWCAAQACLNAAYAGLSAEVPDHVPVAQCGTVSGWVGLPQAVGVVVGVALVTTLVTTPTAGYLVVAVALVVFVLPFPLVTRDARGGRTGPRSRWWIDPREHPDFGWAWLTRFLISLGNATGTLYLLYFLRDRVQYEQLFPGKSAEDGVLVLILIYAAGAIATAVAGGMWSDRTGRRKPLVIVSSLVMAAGALLLAVWPTWTASIVAAALLGTGFGVYMAVDTALITQVLPAAADRGRDLGVINIANAAPQVLAPALAAPIVAGLGGYPVLYGLTALVTLLGAVLVLPIRSVR